jgi:hypothetical protein
MTKARGKKIKKTKASNQNTLDQPSRKAGYGLKMFNVINVRPNDPINEGTECFGIDLYISVLYKPVIT